MLYVYGDLRVSAKFMKAAKTIKTDTKNADEDVDSKSSSAFLYISGYSPTGVFTFL